MGKKARGMKVTGSELGRLLRFRYLRQPIGIIVGMLWPQIKPLTPQPMIISDGTLVRKLPMRAREPRVVPHRKALRGAIGKHGAIKREAMPKIQ